MVLVYIVMLISLATILGVLVWFALQDQHIVCNSNGCTGDCNQGRQCTCGWPGTTEQCSDTCYKTQRKHQLDDEFNNANWPFPVNRP
jgi:hypothetical protein